VFDQLDYGHFCAVTLSSFYLEVGKDRLYTLHADHPVRRSAQSMLYTVLGVLVRLCAPILAFTSEEVWGFMPGRGEDPGSVHLEEFVVLPEEYDNPELAAVWEALLGVRRQVLKELEEARQSKLIGNSLEAEVVLRARGATFDLLTRYREQLSDIFIVSRVELEELAAGDSCAAELELVVEVRHAPGGKCDRCWCYRQDLTPEDATFPGVCERCLQQLESLRSTAAGD